MKLKTVYKCQNCGFTTPKWFGQCPECQKWSTLLEEVVEAPSAKKNNRKLTEFSSEVVKLSESQQIVPQRIKTNIAEIDRLFGGGLVEGQMVLLAGAPGIGKSTLMLQLADILAAQKKVLYVSGEESISQISSRSKRLKTKEEDIYILSETALDKIISVYKKIKPQVLIIDSIQTIYHPEFNSGPGTISQVRETAGEILRLTKPDNTIVFVLGHITKEGSLAGPKILEHLVDTVLYFDTEKQSILRLLRVYKNRFGPTSEISLFNMTQKGLIPLKDSDLAFTTQSRSRPTVGRAFSISMEGTKPLLLEVQALVSPTRYPFARRMVTGLDLNRCQILFAAIEKHLGINLENKDIFVSVAGGIKVTDTALDLAVCASVASSAKDIAVAPDKVFIGEVGILGHIGQVSMPSLRLKEAERLKFAKAITHLTDKNGLQDIEKLVVLQTEELSGLLESITGK